MLIRNLKTNQDLSNAKKLQSEFLQLMIDNEKIQEERMANYQNPNKPPPVPPQYKTSTEVQSDILRQEKDAIDNLLSLGVDYPTASSVTMNLQQAKDGVANLLKLNKNFPFIKKDITERFNPKLLDTQVILSYLEELFAELDDTIGLKTSSQTITDYFQRDATGVASVLPSSDKIKQLKDLISDSITNLVAVGGIDQASVNELNNQLDILIKYLPSEINIKKIDTYPTLEKNRLFKAIEKLIKTYNIPTAKFTNDRSQEIDKYNTELKNAIDSNEPPSVQDGFAESLITELSIVKNTLGLMNDRSIVKLEEIAKILNESDYNIKKETEKLEYGEKPIMSQGGEWLKNYLTGHTRKMGRKTLMDRIAQYPNWYANTDLAKLGYILEAPEVNGEPIFESIKNIGKAKYDKSSPFILARDTDKKIIRTKEGGIIRSAVKIPNIDKYLLFNSISINNNGDIKQKLGSEHKSETYRYSEKDIKAIIEDNEIPYLMSLPNYDPREKSQQRIPSMGFGLTNKIVKHFEKDNKDMKKLAKSYNKHMKVEETVDDGSSSEEEKKVVVVREKKGGFVHTRIKVGKGIEVEESPRYKTFGKYIIHMGHLDNDNVLNVKYPSGGGIPSIKPVTIGSGYKNFINDILNTGKMNNNHFKKLTNGEKKHFVKIARGAKLVNKLGLDDEFENNDESQEKDISRFELLKGEFDAGNNNANLVKELRALLIKFMRDGKINKTQGMDFLMELSLV